MLELLLKKLGLSDKEAKVYLAVLELGEDTVQNIAKKADVNRPNTYVILEKLKRLGLISTIERGKKSFFIAENPKELENLLEQQKREIEQKKTELMDSMDQFKALFNSNQNKPIVRFFEGADGLESLDRYGHNPKFLKRNPEILSIIPIDIVEKYFPERRKRSVGERVKLGIRSRSIYTHERGEIDLYTNNQELREGRFIPRSQFPLTASINIYPEWGVKLFYFDENKPYGVLIESKEIASNFKILFELAWLGANNLDK